MAIKGNPGRHINVQQVRQPETKRTTSGGQKARQGVSKAAAGGSGRHAVQVQWLQVGWQVAGVLLWWWQAGMGWYNGQKGQVMGEHKRRYRKGGQGRRKNGSAGRAGRNVWEKARVGR